MKKSRKKSRKKKSTLSGMEHFHNIERQKDAALEFIKSRRGRIVFQWVFQTAVVLALAAVTAIFFFRALECRRAVWSLRFRQEKDFS